MLLSDARYEMHEYDARIYELRMHMMPYQLVDNTQKLKAKTTRPHCYSSRAYPLKDQTRENDSKDFTKRIDDVVSSTCTQAPART